MIQTVFLKSLKPLKSDLRCSQFSLFFHGWASIRLKRVYFIAIVLIIVFNVVTWSVGLVQNAPSSDMCESRSLTCATGWSQRNAWTTLYVGGLGLSELCVQSERATRFTTLVRPFISGILQLVILHTARRSLCQQCPTPTRATWWFSSQYTSQDWLPSTSSGVYSAGQCPTLYRSTFFPSLAYTKQN